MNKIPKVKIPNAWNKNTTGNLINWIIWGKDGKFTGDIDLKPKTYGKK